jgi:hypothetical protein
MYIPGIIITVAAFFAGIFFYLNSGGKKISVRVFILYSLATAMLFALAGITAIINIENPVPYFIGTQFMFLGLGITHVVVLSRVNTHEEEEDYFWHEFFFTIYVALLGGFIYFILFSALAQRWEFTMPFLLGSLIVFLVPFLFYKTFNYLVAIPEEEYEKWYYPINNNFDDIDEDEFDEKKTIAIKCHVIGQKIGDDRTIVTQALAPLRWEFGDYFAFLINLRNDSKPGEIIEFTDNFGQPNGWMFFVEGEKWYQSDRMIDPKLSIIDNELTGKEIIICKRV